MVFHYKDSQLGPNLCPTGPDKVCFIQVAKGVCCAAISRKNVESENLDFFRENAKSTVENKQML